MKTLTLVSNEYPPLSFGGGGNTARLLVKKLKETETKVNLITVKFGRYSGLSNIEQDGNATIYRIDMSNFFLNKIYKPHLALFAKLPFFSYINKKIFKESDIVHVLSFRDAAFLPKFGKKLVVNVNDPYAALVGLNPFKYYPGKGRYRKYLNYRFFRILDKRSLNKCDYFTTTAEYAREIITKEYGLDKSKGRCVHKGVDVSEFKGEYEKDIDILFIGSRFVEKGAVELIQSVKKLKENYPKIKCVMIGGSSKIDINYNDLISSNGLRNNIEIKPFLDNKEIIKYHLRSKINILPTKIESLAQVLLEAMAAKVPIITTDVGGNSEAVTHGENGFLVKVDDINSIVKYAKLLLDDEKLRKKMGQNGYKKVLEHFNVDRMINDYMNIYNKVLNE